ncbi:MAG: trigger factor [Armatimonadetes bacterium]|nr:trigger factor [Candidatus Hippobium faecium]
MQIINEEQINPCLTSIEIEIEMAEFGSFVTKAYKSAAKQINVPGFRKGKAPRAILKQYVEPQYIADYAAEEFMKKNYEEIIEMSGKKPVAQCSFDIIDCVPDSDSPVTIKLTIPTEPIVKLGDYKGIEVKKYVKEVSDEDIDKNLNELIAQRTKIVPVLDRPVAEGDTLFIETKTKDSEDKPKPERYVVGSGLEDMDKAVIGMEQGDDKDITVNYPADYKEAELAGTAKDINVKIRNIYHNEAPEINDKFIAEMFANAPALPDGGEYPKTVEEFRAYSKEQMQKQLNQQFENMFNTELLNKLVENAAIDFPEALLNQRVSEAINRFANYLKSQNIKVEDYMKAYQLTPQMLTDEFKKQEEFELKKSLVGAEIVKAEDIKATDEEMENAIKEKAEARNSTVEAFKELIDKNENFKLMIEDEIVSKKLMDFIVSNAKVIEEEWDEEKMAAEAMAKQIEEIAEEKKAEETAETKED